MVQQNFEYATTREITTVYPVLVCIILFYIVFFSLVLALLNFIFLGPVLLSSPNKKNVQYKSGFTLSPSKVHVHSSVYQIRKQNRIRSRCKYNLLSFRMRGIDNSFGVLSTFLGVHRFFFLLHPHNVFFFFSSVFYCSDFNKEHFSLVSRSE